MMRFKSNHQLQTCLAFILLFVAAAFASGCVFAPAQNPATHAASCTRPDSTTIPPTLNLVTLAGEYRVTWVTQWEFNSVPGTTQKRLWLWPTSPDDSSREKQRRAVASRIPTPLYGVLLPDTGRWTDSTIFSLRQTIDPVYPPILMNVLPFDVTRRNPVAMRQTPVLLYETMGNSRDGTSGLDGAGDGLVIREVGPNGFRGIFAPWGIVRRDSGYFCATRVRAPGQ